VNLSENSLIGVNVDPDFMSIASTYLNCRIDNLPFVFLGLLMGAKPRNLSTWQPVIDKVLNHLNSWKNKYISMGGRVVFLNWVLNSIPIYMLSFMKLPKKVCNILIQLHRYFLWQGVGDVKKIP
jgi:hypothetical protein